MKLSREIDLLILIYLAVIVFSILYPASFFSLAMAEAVPGTWRSTASSPSA